MRGNATKGFLLFELALVLAVAAIVITPLIHLLSNFNTQQQANSTLADKQRILQAVEGFVLANGRLPCPAMQVDGAEARVSDRCTHHSGWVPASTLQLWGLKGRWRLSVATLSSAGAPAEHALVASNPFEHISLNQLGRVILAPETPKYPVGQGPLPGIHLCQAVEGLAPPPIEQAGCGGHTLLSASLVWVATPEGEAVSVRQAELNKNRHQQFFIDPQLPASHPAFLSFERLNWLWMQRGTHFYLPSTETETP